MISWLALTVALAAPPDTSRQYFPRLNRPAAGSVRIERAGGPVIFIVVDALRPDHLSAYGAPRETSPVMRALADEGVVLTNYFVNGNWTRPSTASMLTGMLPAAHGIERDDDRLGEELTTLPELLAAAGIPTGAVVGNGNAGSAFGFAQGFDYFADTVKHWKGLPRAEDVFELAVPFVEKHRDQPFFLMLFLVDPHDPYNAPAPFEDMFVTDPQAPLIRTPHWEVGRYSAAEIERMRATYDGAVRYTDTAMGAFFDRLRALGVYDEATIIVTSDHGEAFGEHGVYLHAHHLYDEIVRAPFIVRAPVMSSRGGYSHGLFQGIDLLPTLARYFGVAAPQELQGVDVFAHLAQPRRNKAERAVISEFTNFGIRRRMIRTYREKVVLELPADEEEFMAAVGRKSLLPSVSFDRERIMFFDVEKDPRERRDLYTPARAKEPRWARLLRTLRAREKQRTGGRLNVVVEKLDQETYDDLKSLGYIQ